MDAVRVDVASVRRVASWLADGRPGDDDRELASALAPLLGAANAGPGWDSIGALVGAVDAARTGLGTMVTATAELAGRLSRAADAYEAADHRGAARAHAAGAREPARW